MMLRISVLLNCGLLGCAVFLILDGRASRPAEPPVETAILPPAPEAAMTPATPPAKAFHWRQVESPDYRAYISNLRRIGCPEQTIRDLISADVDALYAARRKPLEEKLAAIGAAALPGPDGDLRELRRQEAAVIAALFGSPVPKTNVTTEVAEDTPPSHPIPRVEVSTPLVFQDVDLSGMKLDPGQRQAIEDLRERFLQSIGGTNQDPADPAYAERWQQSQPEIDQDLRGMIGVSAWEEYQLAAGAKSQEQKPSGQ
jgi:hypothetical protein